MAIKIVTDSTCDLPKELIKELNITVLPLRVIFGKEEFVDGVDLTNEEFYEKLIASDELPTTSQVTPEQFTKVFKQAKKDNDTLICIHISSEMSGTIQSAMIAKEHIDYDDIYIVDSLTTTMSLGQVVVEAARARQAGKSAEDIILTAKKYIDSTVLYGIIDTLKYLKKGGRIKASSAIIGDALNIKPIVTINDGLVETASKARGTKKAFAEVKKLVHAAKSSLKGKEIFIGHSYDEEQFEAFKHYLLKHYKPSNIIESKVGSVVGTHAGPGCVMLVYSK